MSNTGISSPMYVINLLENYMLNSRLTVLKRKDNSIAFVKTDIFKYPHRRNILHNLQFNVKTTPEKLTIEVSTKNWEIIFLLILFGGLLLIEGRFEIIELIPVFFGLLVILLAMKHYILGMIKKEMITLLEEI